MPRPKFHPIPDGAIKIRLPDVTQLENSTCGASSLQAICKYYGVGPEEEADIVKGLRMDRRVGSHPFQVKRLAHRYGLETKEEQPMTIRALLGHLRRGRPVMLMIQAWNDDKRWWLHDYRNDWDNGHWVVAVGFDRDGAFFEDPSFQAIRGFLPYAELEVRWHDTGPHGRHVDHYGLVIWKPGAKASAYETRAERIP